MSSMSNKKRIERDDCDTCPIAKRSRHDRYLDVMREACKTTETHRDDVESLDFRYHPIRSSPSTRWLSLSGHVPAEDILAEADSQLFSMDTPVKYMHINADQDVKMKEFMLNNMESIVGSMPIVLSDSFTLIPSQVLAIYHATSIYPFDRVLEATFHASEMRTDISLASNLQPTHYYRPMFAPRESYVETTCIPAGEFQRLQILCYGTGTGKTVMTLASSMLLLSDPVKWKAIQDSSARVVSEHRRESESGFVRGTMHLPVARLVICFVPKSVLAQWEKTATEIKGSFQRHFKLSESIRVWVGHKRTQSIEECVKQGNAPTVWILSLETKSLDVLFESPNINFVALVYDELNVSIRKHSKERRSIPIGPTYIAQATLRSLESNLNNNPMHPIRLSLFDDKTLPYSNTIMEQWYGLSKNGDFGLILAKHLAFRMLLAPFFLRTFMSKNCVSYMPSGLDILRLTYRQTTLAGRLRTDEGTELNISPLDTFLSQLIMTNARNVYADVPAERAELIKDALANMKSDLSGAIDSLRSLLNATTNDAKTSGFRAVAKRIIERLESESFECMICYEAPAKTDVCITGCCTAVYCKKCLNQCRSFNNKCANCRATNFGNAVMSTTFSAPHTEEEPTICPETPLGDAMTILSKAKKPLLTCFIEAIQLLIRDPKSRVVVFCKLQNVTEFESYLRAALPHDSELVNMKSISGNISKSGAFMKLFNDDKDRAVVALCDKSTSSSSIAGIDFKNATSMIIDSMDIGQNLQQQLVGRVLRMNKHKGRAYIPIVMASMDRSV